MINGQVSHLSDDAIQDEHKGLIYATRVTLQQDGLNIDGRFVKLAPGMSVTVEIKTGQRRLIEYFCRRYFDISRKVCGSDK